MWRQKRVVNSTKSGGFPSKLEAAVYEILLQRQILKEIRDIQRQQSVVLQDGPRDVRITWRVDFSFVENLSGKLVYCEAKGFPTEIYKLKLKMFKKNPQANLEIWGGDYKRPKLIELVKSE